MCFRMTNISLVILTYIFTQQGHSALMIAVMQSDIEAVSLLIKAGANIDLQDKV